MNTAKEIIKLIIVILAIVWLCSCGNAKKGRIAEEIKHVKFDIELLGGELSHIDKQMNSFQFVDEMAFAKNNLSTEELKIKRDRAKQAHDDYLELSKTRTRVYAKMIILKVKYDSLQTEYAKY